MNNFENGFTSLLANLRVNFSRPAVDECTPQCSQCEVWLQPGP